MANRKTVWVFNGAGARFASAVFSSKELATHWVSENHLTGILTEYPVDQSAYEWAIENGHYKPRSEIKDGAMMQGFTSAGQNHVHFENGLMEV